MRIIKKIFKWLVLVLLALTLLTIAATWWQQRQRHATASPDALAMMVSDADVLIEYEQRFLTLRPAAGQPQRGLILYPGAYSDIRGYVPTLRPLAAAGYRVVVVPMPFELALYGIGRARNVIDANPDITSWAIIGHSIGGAMAAVFADRHREELAGVILWDSFPPPPPFVAFATYPKPVWLIHRATADGAPPPSFTANRALFPRDSRWAAIPGGIHMQFGSFTGGGYVEDWPPSISEAEQQRTVVNLTLQALEQMFAAPPSQPAS